MCAKCDDERSILKYLNYHINIFISLIKLECNDCSKTSDKTCWKHIYLFTMVTLQNGGCVMDIASTGSHFTQKKHL